MKKAHFPPFVRLILIFSMILITYAISRWIETDAGKILIHKIDIEISETIYAEGKLYRPLAAQSLNQRPAIILVSGLQNDKENLSSMAIELARRGFVALSIDNFGQGSTPERSIVPGESIVDRSYALLFSQPFVDKKRIGIIGFSVGTIDILLSTEWQNFSSILLLTPHEDLVQEKISFFSNPRIHVIRPFFNEFAEFRKSGPTEEQDKQNLVNWIQTDAFQFFMLIHPGTIAEVLDQINVDLQIPDDAPLWFNSHRQTAWIREICQFLGLILWLFIILPISELLVRNPKDHTAITNQDRSFIANNRFSFVWIIFSLSMYIAAIIIAFYVNQNSDFFYKYSSVNCNIIWMSSMVIFLGVPILTQQRKKERKTVIQFDFGKILRSSIVSFSLLILVYGFMLLFSRIFLVDLHFVFPLFRPIDKRWIPFLIVFLISSSFFRLHSRQFLEGHTRKYSLARYLFTGIGCQIFFLVIEYIPAVFFQISGWEWLFALLGGSHNLSIGLQNFNGSGWGLGSLMALFNVGVLALLLILQERLFWQRSDNLSSSLICGGLYSWLLVSGTTLL